MAMEQGRLSWPDAPWEVLGLVVDRLPTLADRFRFGAVCRPWHAAERQLPRRRQLPWLALSLPSSPASDHASFYSLSDRAVYSLPFPAGGGVGAALAGSADDWLVVAHRDRGNFLLDPFTGATLPLPHQRTITRSASRPGHDRLVEYYPPRSQREPYIRKAVLSRRPSADDPAGRCIVAAIVDSGELFFCRPGDSSWRRPGTLDSERIYSDSFQDITFCNGRLYGITKRDSLTFGFERVSVFDVDEDAGELVVSRTGGYSLDKYPGPDDSDESEEEGERPYRYHYHRRPPSLERRYCVESRGRLLMVERYCWCYENAVRHFGAPACSRCSTAPLVLPKRWRTDPFDTDVEVPFLSGSGPRSFAAAEHGVDADCIYFADDHCQEGDKNLYYYARSRDDDCWSDDPAETQPCGDIGRYCMRDKSVTLLTKELPANERRSPPVWLYLSDQRR